MICRRLVEMPSTFSPRQEPSPKTTTYWCFLREIMGNGWLNICPIPQKEWCFLGNIYIYIPIYSHIFPSFPHWLWIVSMDHSFPSPFRKHQKKPGFQGYWHLRRILNPNWKTIWCPKIPPWNIVKPTHTYIYEYLIVNPQISWTL